jgi:hypothetical protein
MMMLRRMRWARHVARIWAKYNTYIILLGKPERKRPLRRPEYRWEHNIEINLKEMECVFVDWMDVWLRIGTMEGSCEHGIEPSGYKKRWEVLEWLHNWLLLKKASVPRSSVS